MKIKKSSAELNYEIELFIDAWEGTSYGEELRLMYENGASYEEICNFIKSL